MEQESWQSHNLLSKRISSCSSQGICRKSELDFLVIFKEKFSFPEPMVSIRAMEMHTQGEQAILAKLKIIVMCHRGVADYDFFCPIIKVNKEEQKIYSKFFMYVWNKKLLCRKNRSCLSSQCKYQNTELHYLI